MDDDRIAAIAFVVAFGGLLLVKGFQNLRGNIEWKAGRDPIRWLAWWGIVCLAAGFAIGVIV